MIISISKTRTQEQISKMMINEERTIIDLELAKKEQFRNYIKDAPDFNDGYGKVADTISYELDMSAVCWCTEPS